MYYYLQLCKDGFGAPERSEGRRLAKIVLKPWASTVSWVFPTTTSVISTFDPTVSKELCDSFIGNMVV
jgi:hypothetical protein